MRIYSLIAACLAASGLIASDEPFAKIQLKDVACLAVNSTGTLLACGTRDKKVHLWDVENSSISELSEKTTDEPFTIAISPDDRWVAVAGFNEASAAEIQVWSLSTRKFLRTITGQWRGVYQLAFTRDGKQLVVGGFLRRRLSALVFDVETGNEVSSFPTPTYDACAPVALSPDGKLIATSGEDGTVHVRELKGGKSVYQKQDGAMFLLQFADDGKSLVGAYAGDDELWQWDVKDWKIRKTMLVNGSSCSSRGALSPNGRMALMHELIDVDSGAVLFKWKLDKDEQSEASGFSGDSKRFSIARENGTVGVWKVEDVLKGKTVEDPR